MFRQRVRVRFDKEGLVRFISHRDLMRLFERSLRRAGLPLAVTQGYNPHPRLSFPLALGTGMAGENEVMEFELCEWMPLGGVREALARQLPPGLLLRDLRAVSPQGTTIVTAIRYQVRFLASPPVSDDQVAALLVRESVPVSRTRKGEPKTVDIRPFLAGLRLEGNCLTVECAVRDGSTTRPEEVLAALGVDVEAWLPRMEMARTQTVLAEPTEAAGAPRPGGRRSARPRR